MGRAAGLGIFSLALALQAASLHAQVPAAERPGAALRSALEARSAGRLDEAAADFDAAEARWPLIADHAARLALETRSAADEPQAVLAGAERFAARYPSSPLRLRVARLRGDAASRLGQGDVARNAWREALAGAPDADARAALLLAIAASEADAGQTQAARDDFLAAWTAAPGSPDAANAESALAALEARGSIPPRGAAEWGRRGEALAGAGLHDDAVRAFDRALALPGADAQRGELLRARAFALFRARRYPEAEQAFAAIAGAEARFYRTRARARGGDRDGAIAAFEAIGDERGAYASQARLLAASLLDDDPAQRERAAALYAAVAESRDETQAREARWRLGWLRYTGGALADARTAFERLAAAESDPVEALRARYFALRARERSGEGGLAGAYAALAREFPLSYYGWRARDRAVGQTIEPAPRAAEPLGEAALPGSATERIGILLEAGLSDDADAEIGALAAHAGSDADRVAIARFALAAGHPERGTRLLVEGRGSELARGPAPGREAIWQLAWPRAFAQEVEARAAAEAIPAELVYALMREESSFSPRALSPVGARGLLQLMPESAGRVAHELGLPAPDPDALYEPALNVQLGAHLLGGLVREFGGRLSAAIGGYNAGSAAVRGWLAEDLGMADDEWVEAIPYDETRGYVRRVLRSLYVYRTLP